ncbi:hypothetical protein F4782DRAFT_523961 [Xylaria castorea]|nr:hypothetical protein F4782DRAFT_523961 [Xylaria castorea]
MTPYVTLRIAVLICLYGKCEPLVSHESQDFGRLSHNHEDHPYQKTIVDMEISIAYETHINTNVDTIKCDYY